MSNGHGKSSDGDIGLGASLLCLVVLFGTLLGCSIRVADVNDAMCKDAGWAGGNTSGVADTACYEKGIAAGSGGEIRHECSISAIVAGTCYRVFEDVE